MKLDLQSYSKLIIFLPLIVLGLLVLTESKKPPKLQRENKVVSTPSVSIKSSMKIDLKGESVCTVNNSEINAKISIKNYSISGILISKNEKQAQTTTQLILKDDCAYIWEKGNIFGQKFCGVKQYLFLYEKISSIAPIDISSVISAVFEFIPKGAITKDQASMSASLSRSEPVCTPQNIDPVIFDIPKGITFKETKVN